MQKFQRLVGILADADGPWTTSVNPVSRWFPRQSRSVAVAFRFMSRFQLYFHKLLHDRNISRGPIKRGQFTLDEPFVINVVNQFKGSIVCFT